MPDRFEEQRAIEIMREGMNGLAEVHFFARRLGGAVVFAFQPFFLPPLFPSIPTRVKYETRKLRICQAGNGGGSLKKAPSTNGDHATRHF